MRNKLKELDEKIRRAESRLRRLLGKFWIRYGRHPEERAAVINRRTTGASHD